MAMLDEWLRQEFCTTPVIPVRTTAALMAHPLAVFDNLLFDTWRNQKRLEKPTDSPRGNICTEIGVARVELQ